jgi:Resolvase, N terminal domain
MPHRCAIYTRQSRHSRGEFSSCEAQFKLCFVIINSMQAQEWSLVDNRYDDIGQSSETLHRPAMERLISEIEDRLIDRVIVTRLDRISRRLQHTCNFFQILDEMGTAITIASQPEIGGDAQGRLLINLMAAFAQIAKLSQTNSVAKWLRRKQTEHLLCLTDLDPPLMVQIKQSDCQQSNVRFANELIIIPVEMITPQVCPWMEQGDRWRVLIKGKRYSVGFMEIATRTRESQII